MDVTCLVSMDRSFLLLDIMAFESLRKFTYLYIMVMSSQKVDFLVFARRISQIGFLLPLEIIC